MKKTIAAAMLLAFAAPAHAQDAVYRARPDSVWYRKLNVYRMYVVRGGDTLGSPVTSLSVERQRWSGAAPLLRADVDELRLNVSRTRTHHVYAVTPQGKVETIDGQANLERGSYDAFPHLPPGGRLEPGTAWSDTVFRTRQTDAGPYVYSIVRRWRVAGRDGDGSVRVEGTGTLRYRDVYGDDAESRWWIDVSGPMSEHYRYDPATGTFREHGWSMDLRGSAGLPGASGRTDSVPAGLKSALTRRDVGRAAAEVLARDLPAGDTSYTSNGGARVLLHTVARTPGVIESGLGRNDGMVGTARSDWDGARQRSYQALWTDSTGSLGGFRIEPAEGGLRVHAARDTALQVPPADAWAMADDGMEEHLAPALAGLRTGQTIAVYHPFPRTWEIATVAVRELSGARAYILSAGGENTVLLVDASGDLLAVALGTGLGERLPAPGTERRRRVDALLQAMRGGRTSMRNRRTSNQMRARDA
ncbi:MAG TPA: hypothetical protein VF092_31120 [Longimicrobium sp.]